ncbi:MAG: DUF721 domain-containing protein [Oscillatoriales cyanobacterium SM2_2_1]|nr:DUF721 domain-containing protein [Oscillatoriales cyanobacterium SM2_2_1]
MGRLTAIGRVLQQLPEQGNWHHIRRFAQIQAHWPELVGGAVAAQTRPTAIYHQVLHVAVSSPVWAQALTFERSPLMLKINQVLGVKKFPPIRDIRYSTARWAEISMVAIAPPRSQGGKHGVPSTPEAGTAQDIVQRLSRAHAPGMRCPQCRRPSSSEELARWQMCRFCARDRWFTT